MYFDNRDWKCIWGYFKKAKSLKSLILYVYVTWFAMWHFKYDIVIVMIGIFIMLDALYIILCEIEVLMCNDIIRNKEEYVKYIRIKGANRLREIEE